MLTTRRDMPHIPIYAPPAAGEMRAVWHGALAELTTKLDAAVKGAGVDGAFIKLSARHSHPIRHP
jgi:hypothetical protein